MDMDMDMNSDDSAPVESSTGSNTANSPSMTPVAHIPAHHHGLPILQTNLKPLERQYWENYNTTTYFNIQSENQPALWVHVSTLLLALLVLYPVSLCLNNIDSKWFLPALTLNLIDVIISLIALKVFGSTAPNLYPGQCYGKMSWILLFVSITHFVFAIIHTGSKFINSSVFEDDDDNSSSGNTLTTSFIPLEDYSKNQKDSEDSSNRYHDRLGSPSTLIDSSSSSSDQPKLSDENFNDIDLDVENNAIRAPLNDDYYNNYHEQIYNSRKSVTAIKRDSILAKVFQFSLIKKIIENSKFSLLSSIIFNALNFPLLGYFLVYTVVGLTVGNLFGQGNRVFNLLAHFIKGGVFFTLGVFSLARYCGALSRFGLAWNKHVVFKNQVDTNSLWYKLTPHGLITMEGYESFMIFFYGTTNVFLEHLASPGGAWTPKDLQHVSIAFMYIGSGLCGLITEALLSQWRFKQTLSNTNINPSAIHAGSPGYSPNPFPVFTIFWTGILMSKHEQASSTSTAIHVQWGYLLSYGSFFRLLTFILLMLLPNKNLNAARPFTELITSFCLIAGGLIFMQSTDQVVEALEYRGLTSMFTLNVNVGIVTLLMGWEMSLLIWKNWLKKRQQI